MPYNSPSSKEGGSVLLKLVRIAILVVLTFLVLSLVIAVARPETGILEKVVLVAGVLGLIAANSPARRNGRKT
jgi:hypothetical protein